MTTSFKAWSKRPERREKDFGLILIEHRRGTGGKRENKCGNKIAFLLYFFSHVLTGEFNSSVVAGESIISLCVVGECLVDEDARFLEIHS